MRRLTVPALCLGLVVAVPASAQTTIESLGLTVSGSAALLTDYTFRGISQTDTKPALQAGIDIEHETGLYVAGFGSNVDFGDANLELDAMFGYRFSLAGIKFDLGGIYYAYPGANEGGLDYNFFEVAAKAAYEIGPATLRAAFHWSPEFQFESGNGYYVEGGVDLKLPFEFVLAGRLGYQWIDKNDRFGLKDFANWSIVLSRELFGFTFAIGYYDTNIRKSDCPKGIGGSNVCEARAIASVSKTF